MFYAKTVHYSVSLTLLFLSIPFGRLWVQPTFVKTTFCEIVLAFGVEISFQYCRTFLPLSNTLIIICWKVTIVEQNHSILSHVLVRTSPYFQRSVARKKRDLSYFLVTRKEDEQGVAIWPIQLLKLHYLTQSVFFNLFWFTAPFKA